MDTTKNDSKERGTIDVNEVEGKREKIKKFLVDNKGTGFRKDEIENHLDVKGCRPYTGDPDIWRIGKYSWYTVNTKRFGNDKYYYAAISRVKVVIALGAILTVLFFIVYAYLVSIGVISV